MKNINIPSLEMEEIANNLAKIFWGEKIVDYFPRPHNHDYLQIGLESTQIDENTKIRDPIVDGMIALCNHDKIEFDFIWAQSAWVEYLAQKIKKPFLKLNNQSPSKLLLGKRILLIFDEFHILNINEEKQKVYSHGGMVKDVMSITYTYNQEIQSPVDLKKLEEEVTIHYLLTKKIILEAKPKTLPIETVKKGKSEERVEQKEQVPLKLEDERVNQN